MVAGCNTRTYASKESGSHWRTCRPNTSCPSNQPAGAVSVTGARSIRGNMRSNPSRANARNLDSDHEPPSGHRDWGVQPRKEVVSMRFAWLGVGVVLLVVGIVWVFQGVGSIKGS